MTSQIATESGSSQEQSAKWRSTKHAQTSVARAAATHISGIGGVEADTRTYATAILRDSREQRAEGQVHTHGEYASHSISD